MKTILKITPFVCLILLISACQSPKGEEWLVENQTVITTTVNTDRFIIPNEAYLDQRLSDLKKHEKDLSEVDTQLLSNESTTTFNDLKIGVAEAIEAQEKIEIYYHDPSLYDISNYLKGLSASLDIKPESTAKNMNHILSQADTFYHVAKANLTAIQIENGKIAIEDHIAAFHWLNDELIPAVQKNKIPTAEKNKLLTNIENLKPIIKDYIGYVNSLINNVDDLTFPTKVVGKK